ncbi:hypothetical protein FBZ84_102284 [Azospirillum baldaniorum]|nr:hypothetical protein FBZ84_102284 [Azospirillum baldaniorum]
MGNRIAGHALPGTRRRVGLLQSTMTAILPGRGAPFEGAGGEGDDHSVGGHATFGTPAALAVLGLPLLVLIVTALVVVFGGR